MEVNINEIKPSPYQPRTIFDIEQLTKDIAHDGLLMPLTVRKVKDFYELIDGDRRLHALKVLGMKTANCSIIIADDSTARKMVWKINIDRTDYSVEEKARYLKKLSDMGMTFYAIGKELNEDDQWVLANVNVFKFPIDIQQAIWINKLTVSHIQRLEPIIGAGQIDKATKVLHEAMDRKLTAKETGESARGVIDEIENQRLESAKKAVSALLYDGKIGVDTPTGVTTPKLDLESPEGLENTANILRRKAKTDREAKLTPEERQKQIDDKCKEDTEKKQKQRERVEQIKSEAKLEGMKATTKEIIKANPMIIQEAINDAIAELKTESPSITFSPEELQKMEEYKTHLRELDTNLDMNVVMRNKNWLAHGQILSMKQSLRDPITGKGIEDLVWKSSGLTVEEAYKKLKGGE